MDPEVLVLGLVRSVDGVLGHIGLDTSHLFRISLVDVELRCCRDLWHLSPINVVCAGLDVALGSMVDMLVNHFLLTLVKVDVVVSQIVILRTSVSSRAGLHSPPNLH